jgi:hypothetical protein
MAVDLRFFEYSDLPEHLQKSSMQFHKLAHYISTETPEGAEKQVALRKLLEAKDACVRAFLYREEE